jgi:ubiquinone biosynthesis protein COQ9
LNIRIDYKSDAKTGPEEALEPKCRAFNRLNAAKRAAYKGKASRSGTADMLDNITPRDRIVTAALRLAEAHGWRGLSLGDIAGEAGIPLAEVSKTFQSKSQILAAFSGAVDQAVLERFPAPSADVPRDRLFDVLITRFEVMQPYKAAIRRIRDDLGTSFGEALVQVGPAMQSQYWMLAAAGLSGEGGAGLLRIQGLSSVYRRVFSIWLDDDDPGMARTMAALDRRLRRAESIVKGVERVRDGFRGFARSLRSGTADKEEPKGPVSAPVDASEQQV